MYGSESAKPEKGRIKAGRLIAVILAVLVAYCCIYSLVVRAVRSETLPMPLGFGVGVVLTGSMEPALSVDDLIVAVKAKEFKAGDIVVYQTGGTPVVHRVVEIDEQAGLVIVKGDANNAPDDPVTISRIKGRVLFSIPYAGALMRLVKSVPGMIMVLIVLFLLLFLSIRSKEQDRSEENKLAELEKEIGELRRQFGEEAPAGEAGEESEGQPDNTGGGSEPN